ncbi:unnamed protein product [Prunus armeniaca]|uniref:Uncharacterized protein n=1 Tax=Prunus armeniaca TaxID=36596 RepID=A0A6J5UWJ0_PRUAR|nr:unnamed protein product [Prunus armeniaca]
MPYGRFVVWRWKTCKEANLELESKGLFWLQQKQTRILILKEPVKCNYEKITTLSKATNFAQPLLGSSLLKFSCYLDGKGRKRHKKKVLNKELNN